MTLGEQMEFRRLLSIALEKFSREGTDPNAVMGMLVALESWIDKTIDANITRAISEVVFKNKQRN